MVSGPIRGAGHPALNCVLRTCQTLFESGDVIEIRALDVGRSLEHGGSTRAGYFNVENTEAISAAVRSLDGKAEGIYVVLNRCNPELLSRSANRLRVKPKHTTTDADIVEWRWLYVDADANRPAGMSSTNAEHQLALNRVREIRDFLGGCGWPEPIHGDSGNGAHLLYRLPALELASAGALVKGCLKSLSGRFSDALVKVDQSTATAARLCKLYGTMTRKGDSTPERPHRRSALIAASDHIEPVALEQLEALAGETVVRSAETKLPAANGGNVLDVEQWLIRNDLEILKGPEAYGDGRKWTLPRCLFNPEHAKPVLIQYESGALLYRCLHKSCSEKTWAAFRQLVESEHQELGNSTSFCGTKASRITSLSQIPSVFGLERKLEWRVEGMIAQGSITMICAESGTGKTWLGYYLAGCVANCIPVLGHSVIGCKVLYLDGENPLYVAKQRLKDLGFSDSPNLTMWGGWNAAPPPGPNDPLVIEFAREHKGLIVYDSLIEFHSGSEQSSTETRTFMRRFRHLANFGASVVVLHHSGKAETSKLYRGSSDIKAAVDTAYALTRTGQELAELGDLALTCFKGRLAPGRNFSMKFKKGKGFLQTAGGERKRDATEVVAEILTDAPASNQSQIVAYARKLGLAKAQIEACLKSGDWTKRPGPNNSTLYSLGTERADNHASAD